MSFASVFGGRHNAQFHSFASVCIPPECTALDLASRDFGATLQRVSKSVDNPYANEYVVLHERIAEINKFLDTGWTCGEYKVPWNAGWSADYGLVVMWTIMAALSLELALFPRDDKKRKSSNVNLSEQC